MASDQSPPQPATGALADKPDPATRRPPTWLRNALVVGWVFVVGYFGNVCWNIYQLVRTGLSGVTSDSLHAALQLPGPLADPNAPLWELLVFAAGFFLLVGACVWA